MGEFFNVPAEVVRRYFNDVIKPLYMHECGYDDPDAVTWAADAAAAAADAAANDRFTDAGVEVEVDDESGEVEAPVAPAATATRVVKSNAAVEAAAEVRHQRRLELAEHKAKTARDAAAQKAEAARYLQLPLWPSLAHPFAPL